VKQSEIRKPVIKRSKPKRRAKLDDLDLNEGPAVDAKRDSALARFLSTPPKPQSKRICQDMLDIGQQVVCTAEWADGAQDEHGNVVPVFKGVYTVRGFVTDAVSGDLGIYLVEIVNRSLPCQPDGHLGERA
jgi:hypothetical protein